MDFCDLLPQNFHLHVSFSKCANCVSAGAWSLIVAVFQRGVSCLDVNCTSSNTTSASPVPWAESGRKGAVTTVTSSRKLRFSVFSASLLDASTSLVEPFQDLSHRSHRQKSTSRKLLLDSDDISEWIPEIVVAGLVVVIVVIYVIIWISVSIRQCYRDHQQEIQLERYRRSIANIGQGGGQQHTGQGQNLQNQLNLPNLYAQQIGAAQIAQVSNTVTGTSARIPQPSDRTTTEVTSIELASSMGIIGRPL